MQSQMVGAAERPVARLAHERLGARVFAHVARQLVRPREAPVAVLPGAEIRLLTWERTGSVRWCGSWSADLRKHFEG